MHQTAVDTSKLIGFSELLHVYDILLTFHTATYNIQTAALKTMFLAGVFTVFRPTVAP